VEQEYGNGEATFNGFELASGHVVPSEPVPSGSVPLNGRIKSLVAESNGHLPDEVPAASNGHGSANGQGVASAYAPVNGKSPLPAAAHGGSSRPLQHVGDARRRQGLSVRCVAQRLNMSVGEVRAQEETDSDMSLSQLYRWQAVLDVPMEELLAEPEDTLSSRVLTRARMLRVMKTARALRAQARSEGEQRLAKSLISQLIEIMPELKEVAAWPTVGHRRSADEMGRIAERPIPADFMNEAS
jgi:transcriptional regulator with XRE-family HTH domain